MNIVLPKFLTVEIARQAVGIALEIMCNSPITGQFKRQACHIVILVPAMKDDRPEYPDWPVYPLQPHLLYEQSYNPDLWTGKCDEIARRKALQLWQDRNDGSATVLPHLLFPGDTQYWGGVKRQGIVVTCSGVDPWHDRMLAAVIAELCIGMAFHAFQKSAEVADKIAFLT